MARPLTNATKTERDFAWTLTLQKSFDNLKECFVLALILQTFNLKRKLVVETNVFDRAIRACLS